MSAHPVMPCFKNGWLRVVAQIGLIAFGFMLLLVSLALLSGRYLIPSSHLIAFASDVNGNWEIYLLDIDHQLFVNLTHDRADDFGPAWSPTLGKIAFYADRNRNGSAEIYQMNRDGTAVRMIVNKPGNLWRPQWSADGRHVAFIRDSGNILVLDTANHTEIALGYGFGPTWSPVAARLALYTNQPGDPNADVYVVDVDGKQWHNLTLHAADDWGPAWSPDGKHIAFMSSRAGNKSEIYVMPFPCTAPCPVQRLTDNTTKELALAWSPDGTLIVFEAEIDGISQLFMMNADGSNLHHLRATSAENTSPVFVH